MKHELFFHETPNWQPHYSAHSLVSEDMYVWVQSGFFSIAMPLEALARLSSLAYRDALANIVRVAMQPDVELWNVTSVAQHDGVDDVGIIINMTVCGVGRVTAVKIRPSNVELLN